MKLDKILASARDRLASDRAKRTIRAAERALEARAWEEETVGIFREAIAGCRTAPLLIPPRSRRPAKGRLSETAILCIGDSHVGKIVRPDATLGFGNYNLDIFSHRAWHLANVVSMLMEEKLSAPPRELVIFFLGDLVEGGLSHGAEIPSRELVADQVLYAAHTFYQVIARLSAIAPIRVRGIVGNHGRWPGMKKMPTEARHSNLDFIVLGMIEAMAKLALPDRVSMQVSRSAFHLEEVEGHRIKIGHGDSLRGGDKALGIPAHAIGREINATTQRYSARGERPPAYYLVGDKHRKLEVPTATGRFLINGAWFDGDEFALHSNFTPNAPHQVFFGMDREIGKTWSYDVFLERAKASHGFIYPEGIRG